MFNNKGVLLVVGANYHTTWQSHKAMRFVLKEINGNKVTLTTRTTNKIFTSNADDLILINTRHNLEKVNRLKKSTHINL